MNYPTWLTLKLVRDFMLVLYSSKFEEDAIRTSGTIPEKHFPVISQRNIIVAMVTTALTKAVPKLYAVDLNPQQFYKIYLLMIGQHV